MNTRLTQIVPITNQIINRTHDGGKCLEYLLPGQEQGSSTWKTNITNDIFFVLKWYYIPLCTSDSSCYIYNNNFDCFQDIVLTKSVADILRTPRRRDTSENGKSDFHFCVEPQNAVFFRFYAVRLPTDSLSICCSCTTCECLQRSSFFPCKRWRGVR